MPTTKLLPAFPLNIVVLPGEEFYLHIFEPRYKQLIKDMQDTDGEFVLPFVEKSSPNDMGVVVKLKTVFSVYPGGEMDIAVEGTGLFELHSMIDPFPEKLYPGASVGIIETGNPSSDDLLKLRPLLLEYLQLKKGEPVKLSSERPFNSFDAAVLLTLPTEKKLLLISLASEHHRILWLINEIKVLMQARKMEIQLQENYYLN
ncbi:MAG: LON peptidase substrate-binding domain-containing protein [Bacteroidia bacterium]